MADDDGRLIRPATPGERADPRLMHRANQAAWDEAAERYEGWLADAVAEIRAGRTNLFGVEIELIGEIGRRGRKKIGSGKRFSSSVCLRW